ncbi:MAG: acylphosphatase [Cyanobacteria bacterium P01_A01_bin.135]
MATGSTAVHVLIAGVVQGVGYRWSTQEMAKAQGLTGWVRNLPDGRVEAVFEGDGEAVEAMLRWCHQGPPAAAVNEVTVEHQDSEESETFEIRR